MHNPSFTPSFHSLPPQITAALYSAFAGFYAIAATRDRTNYETMLGALLSKPSSKSLLGHSADLPPGGGLPSGAVVLGEGGVTLDSGAVTSSTNALGRPTNSTKRHREKTAQVRICAARGRSSERCVTVLLRSPLETRKAAIVYP